ncbi:MAG: hypothetical protein ABSD08_15290 [Xanthobacteraceae bacterium]|jgi:hypothetical protein
MTGKAPKPDLDDATIQIARRMLSTPPKPHDEMKIGKSRPKRNLGKPETKRTKAKKKYQP